MELFEEIAYLEGRQTGLGKRFYRDVLSVEQMILRFPEAGAPIGGEVRALLLTRFPHAVHYSLGG